MMAQIIRGIKYGKESSTHEKGSETLSKQRKEWKKLKRLSLVKAEERIEETEAAKSDQNVAGDISAEMTWKINTTMFHTKNLKRENPYYSARLKTIQWENFPVRPPWNAVYSLAIFQQYWSEFFFSVLLAPFPVQGLTIRWLT